MMVLQRKLLVRFSAEQKFLPENMMREKTYRVVAYYIKKRVVFVDNNNGKRDEREDLYFIFIGEKNRLSTIGSWNCETYIDATAEPNFDHLIELMKGLSLLGKALCEKMATYPNKKRVGKDGGETGTAK
jgi:hypothetical protein